MVDQEVKQLLIAKKVIKKTLERHDLRQTLTHDLGESQFNVSN